MTVLCAQPVSMENVCLHCAHKKRCKDRSPITIYCAGYRRRYGGL